MVRLVPRAHRVGAGDLGVGSVRRAWLGPIGGGAGVGSFKTGDGRVVRGASVARWMLLGWNSSGGVRRDVVCLMRW